MYKTKYKIVTAFLAIICGVLFFSYSSTSRTSFQKYDLEKGILTFSYDFPLMKSPIEKKIYFSNYGATEYFEFFNNENSSRLPILKIDNIEHIFIADSMVISKERGFDFIFEKLTKRKKSKLSNDDLDIIKISDTLIYNKDCKLIEFKIKSTKQKGKAALWKGIPIWINSKWEKGLHEDLTLIKIDLESDIPIEKTKVMDYIDME